MTDPPPRTADGLRRLLDAESARAKPNFAEVLARVSPQADLPETETYVDLGEPPTVLASACDALRDRIEADLQSVLASPHPAPRLGARGSARGVVVLALVAVVAAAVLAWVVAPGWFRSATAEESTPPGTVAADAVRAKASEQSVTPREAASARRRVRAPRATEPKAALPMEPAPQPEPTSPIAPNDSPRSSVAASPPLAERIATLDARAQARWKAGNTSGAAADFRRIVKIGGRRKSVELAYAELFALARQRGDDLTGLWRAYLRRFPRGRYAREASAGLCRAAAASERDRCWKAHASQFPAPGSGAPK